MKTKPFIHLLAALAFSACSLHAEDLCGGADDDQFETIVPFNDPRSGPVPLCGGMDDDQFRPPPMRGIVSDTLGLVSDPLSLHGDEDSDTMSEFDALWNMVMQPPAPQVDGIESDRFGVRLPPPPPAGIVGGDGADFVRFVNPMAPAFGGNGTASFGIDDPWLLFLIYGETGSDSLWGGGGTDEIVADDTVDWYR